MVLILTGAGLPLHKENREFKSPFFQTGKTQGGGGNLLNNIKNMFLHREFTTSTGKIMNL